MPRISMWRENHTNDYKFMDRRISEEFTVGGTGVLLHKYLSPLTQANAYPITTAANVDTRTLTFGNISTFEVGQTLGGMGITPNTVIVTTNVSTNSVTISSNITETISSGTPINVFWRDGTQPVYQNATALNIQDLLWLENRDRKYDTSIYKLRGIYNVNNNDFDLQQFGIFLSADTIYMTFHLNDIVALVGRKLMSGDVLELQHKKDYYPLNADIPAVLKRYYVIQDVTFDAEGFSQTWWPHLIRAKLTPLVDSQEYKDLLNNISSGDANNTPIGQIISNFNKLNQINDAIITQAQIDVPKSGTNIDPIYIEPLNPDGSPGDPTGSNSGLQNMYASSISDYSSDAVTTPDTTIPAYLGGDGSAPNGFPVLAATTFPGYPEVGDYCLRTDYIPNRLFRWNGTRWLKIDDNVRTDLTPGPNNQTQRSVFVNNTDTFVNDEGQTIPVRQSLSKALTPKADN